MILQGLVYGFCTASAQDLDVYTEDELEVLSMIRQADLGIERVYVEPDLYYYEYAPIRTTINGTAGSSGGTMVSRCSWTTPPRPHRPSSSSSPTTC
jgi:hypothetical protein